MFNTVLSYSESAVLGVVAQTGAAYPTELPSKTRLAPHEVGEALSGLIEKHLLASLNGELRLTKEGEDVVASMRGSQSSSGPNRVFLTDKITARNIVFNTNSARLSESIDEEIAKL